MSEQTHTEKSLGDYVASAIAPVLIMALIGSLVFFLVEVMYIGQYYGRLLWIVFFFIFGMVLVARISMRGDIAGRAGLYGLVLGLLMWLALNIYVEFPRGSWAADLGWAVHLGIVLLIWWSAQRLTADCTLDQDKGDASGAGLLDVAGLEGKPQGQQAEDADEATARTKKKKKRRSKGLISWWERFQDYREDRQQRPRTHGVWVVYFSLAALPLFGLGQALIPADHTGRRQYAFWLMCIYVASSLGLLLCTAFLTLRRYLRQRKLRMPVAITTTWIVFGATLIVGLLVLGALLPRPYPEYSVVEQFVSFGSPKQKASQWAVKGDTPTEGDGSASGQPSDQEQSASSDKSGKQQSSGKGTGEKGKQGDGGQKGKNSSEKGQSQQSDGKSADKSGQQGNGAKGQKQPNQAQKNQDGKSGDQKEGEKKDSKSNTASAPPASTPSTLSSWFEWMKPLLAFLKWVVLVVVVLVVIVFLLRAVLSFLANFTFWAKDLLNWFRSWWKNLWSRDSEAKPQQTESPASAVPHRPFSWYRDPFESGKADQMSEAELIRYSFEALQAWARERHLSRPTAETPLEFARRVGEEFPALEEDAQMLASYYATAAYAPRLLQPDCVEDLRDFWHMLHEVTERPLSAGMAR